jgi:integrase
MSEINRNSPNAQKRDRSAPRYWVEIKGKLYARLQYRADNGKYQVKYKPIADKRKARAAVEEMRRELATHGEETLRSDRLGFAALAAEYQQTKLIPAVYANGVKIAGRRSVKSLESHFKVILDHFGHKTLRSLKPVDIENFKTRRLSSVTMRGGARKIASVNRELALLRAMLNFAVQNGWIIQNPFEKTKGVISTTAEAERDRVLSFSEEERLLAACTARRAHLKALLVCALDTAMRRGEILKMRWRDVNFESGEIFIPQTNTKTEESRTVGTTPRLQTELERLWEASAKEKDLSIFGISNTVKTAFKSACRDAGIKDFRFHDCRHTATTRMIASGSPHTEVMKITGHTQLKTFLRYLNITPETARTVAARLNDYIADKQLTSINISSQVN